MNTIRQALIFALLALPVSQAGFAQFEEQTTRNSEIQTQPAENLAPSPQSLEEREVAEQQAEAARKAQEEEELLKKLERVKKMRAKKAPAQ